MVRHTQKIRRLLPTNFLKVFDHFVVKTHDLAKKIDNSERFKWIFLYEMQSLYIVIH